MRILTDEEYLAILEPPCPLCSGDREPREGEGWPGHDRACVIGLSRGTVAARVPAMLPS